LAVQTGDDALDVSAQVPPSSLLHRYRLRHLDATDAPVDDPGRSHRGFTLLVRAGAIFHKGKLLQRPTDITFSTESTTGEVITARMEVA
jgi:hypothetical protein